MTGSVIAAVLARFGVTPRPGRARFVEVMGRLLARRRIRGGDL